jgi:hypothetical protein
MNGSQIKRILLLLESFAQNEKAEHVRGLEEGHSQESMAVRFRKV